jgi:hypothetical protein
LIAQLEKVKKRAKRAYKKEKQETANSKQLKHQEQTHINLLLTVDLGCTIHVSSLLHLLSYNPPRLFIVSKSKVRTIAVK